MRIFKRATNPVTKFSTDKNRAIRLSKKFYRINNIDEENRLLRFAYRLRNKWTGIMQSVWLGTDVH